MITFVLPAEKEAAEFCRSAGQWPHVKVVIAGYQNRLWGQVENRLMEGDYLICGTAGALDDSLMLGDLFLPEAVGGASDITHWPDNVVRAVVQRSLEKNDLKARVGKLVTSPVPVTNGAKRLKLRERGYAAVDMETWWLMALLARNKRPAAALRIVSDVADTRAKTDYQKNLPELSRRLSQALTAVAIFYGTPPY